jgi:thiamine transporter ThiT
MNKVPHTKILHALFGARTPLLFETYSSFLLDMTHVFTLDAFESVFQVTQYKNELLKRESFKSTIMACFLGCTTNFSYFVAAPFLFWNSYIPHNAKQSLLNYRTILQNLRKEKAVVIQYAKHLIKSMVGFLYYANYKESNNSEYLRASKRLIQNSLNLEYTCVKLLSV